MVEKIGRKVNIPGYSFDVSKRYRQPFLPTVRRAVTFYRSCAAHAFLRLRSVGRDVAITDNGVKVLEGNVWWDRLCHSDYIRTIPDDINGSQGEMREGRSAAWK